MIFKAVLSSKAHPENGAASGVRVIVGKGGMKENTEQACKEFGAIHCVSIDSEGRNYFEEKKVEYNQRKDEQVELISKQVGFIK